jgi:hypothetical protein
MSSTIESNKLKDNNQQSSQTGSTLTTEAPTTTEAPSEGT